MRAGDIAPLVILIVFFPIATWSSYQMLAHPIRFARALGPTISRFFSKLIPGFDFTMYSRAIPLPWTKSHSKYFLDGTTGFPEKDARIERFYRIYLRAFGLVLAFFAVVMLAVIIGITTGNLHSE